LLFYLLSVDNTLKSVTVVVLLFCVENMAGLLNLAQ